MADNFTATQIATTTAAPEALTSWSDQSEQAFYTLPTLSIDESVALTETSLSVPMALTSPESNLQNYLEIARHSLHPAVMENAFNIALRTQRALVNATLSNTMPTALKIKTCEIPILNLLLEFAARSADWRALIVKMLVENIESGCGHLTVNRAKQVLKEIAKRAGSDNLAAELEAETLDRRLAAINMLGWLKHERAIPPLVNAFRAAGFAEKKQMLSVLETHYLSKLAFYVNWRHQGPGTVDGALLALIADA